MAKGVAVRSPLATLSWGAFTLSEQNASSELPNLALDDSFPGARQKRLL